MLPKEYHGMIIRNVSGSNTGKDAIPWHRMDTNTLTDRSAGAGVMRCRCRYRYEPRSEAGKTGNLTHETE